MDGWEWMGLDDVHLILDNSQVILLSFHLPQVRTCENKKQMYYSQGGTSPP
jgi:hypothetical protein